MIYDVFLCATERDNGVASLLPDRHFTGDIPCSIIITKNPDEGYGDATLSRGRSTQTARLPDAALL